jgi:hypothetical protein
MYSQWVAQLFCVQVSHDGHITGLLHNSPVAVWVLQLLDTCGSCAALISPAESSPAIVPSLHGMLCCSQSKRLLLLLLLLRLLRLLLHMWMGELHMSNCMSSNTNSSLRGDHPTQPPQFPQSQNS